MSVIERDHVTFTQREKPRFLEQSHTPCCLQGHYRSNAIKIRIWSCGAYWDHEQCSQLHAGAFAASNTLGSQGLELTPLLNTREKVE